VPTLDQERAGYAWEKARDAKKVLPEKEFDKYRNLAKGAPALVMGSGLMATMAFWQSRGEAPAERLVADLLGWMADRRLVAGKQFAEAMAGMTKQSPANYLAATDEALALLRWLRQCADAIAKTPVA